MKVRDLANYISGLDVIAIVRYDKILAICDGNELDDEDIVSQEIQNKEVLLIQSSYSLEDIDITIKVM